MRALIAAIVTLLLASCGMDLGGISPPPGEPVKPCKHVTMDACNSDPACGWDQYGGQDNTGKCKAQRKDQAGEPGWK